ncbi:MAG: nodulation protein NfeD [Alphaproteobacteria bacterium]
MHKARRLRTLVWASIFGLGAVIAALSGVGTAAAPTGSPSSEPLGPPTGQIVLLDIKGPIGPAIQDYLRRGLEKAAKQNAAAVVLRIDTPGGLSTSMRGIIQDILASPVAVISYVAPSGARAASAGTYILYASHISAMAPGTNLGAATPVRIGGLPGTKPDKPKTKKPAKKTAKDEKSGDDKGDKKDGDKDEDEDKDKDAAAPPSMSDKAVNDAVAYIRSLAQMRGRNVEWAEKAVRQAASLPAAEAVKMNVVDLMADNISDLLAKTDGREVTAASRKVKLATANKTVVAIAPDWRTELLAVLTNPTVAYMLMLIGFYGIIFEFYNPGIIFSGVIGAICLVLALFAFQVLPINYAGLGLIILGVAFMTAEAFMPAFGALGIGGVVAFVIGSVILIDTDDPGFGISWVVIGAFAVSSAAFFFLVSGMAVKAWGRPVVSGQEKIIGSLGRVVEWSGTEGSVRLDGELWRASAAVALSPDQEVRISALRGLTLMVAPADNNGGTHNGSPD